MKRPSARSILILGVLVVLLLAGASWYAITFNDWRLVAPMDFGAYEFLSKDLPMLIALILFNLYVLYLGALLIWAIAANKRRLAETRTTRKLDPRLGLLGVFGLLGFAGFWTYNAFHQVYPFIFFLFFGFFGFFYEGKLSNTFMDERFRENRMRAEYTAMKIGFSILFLSAILLSRGKLLGSLEYSFIALSIVLSLVLGLVLFLQEYLLYRYDHSDSEE